MKFSRISAVTLTGICALVSLGVAQTSAPSRPISGFGGPLVKRQAAQTLSNASPITVDLNLDLKAVDMEFLKKNFAGFMPKMVQFVEERPSAIIKEPAYKGKPLYGAFQVGNGPKSITYFAVDEAPNERGHIYIDVNQNGDLTDDGPGNWDHAEEHDGILNYDIAVTIHASWGSPLKETESGSYTLFAYKRHGDSRMGCTRFTARSGKVVIGSKTYPILLAENSSDGIFTVAKATDRTRGPVTIYIDLDGDGLFKGFTTEVDKKKVYQPETFNAAEPFQVAGTWWDAVPSISGDRLTLNPTSAPGVSTKQAPRKVTESKLLKAGTLAPDFAAIGLNGKPLHLADFKGKVVLLDLWATWCGPCQASMPGLEKIYQQIKSQGVVVLSLNVFDDKTPYEAWIAKNAGTKYSFTFAFDPAGHDDKKSIAATKFGVNAIPTMFIIDRKGKISETIIGSGNEANIVKALGKLGVQAKAE